MTEVDPADLDESITTTADLFQTMVPAVGHLRVTAIGDRVFCVRIDSGDLLDWRQDYNALTYLKRFGLAFGCFDFALHPDGTPLFLERTPMGNGPGSRARSPGSWHQRSPIYSNWGTRDRQRHERYCATVRAR